MDRLELPKSKYQIRKADRNQKSICLFYYPKKGEIRYAAERISQTAQGSVRHQDGRQQMDGSTVKHRLCGGLIVFQ